MGRAKQRPTALKHTAVSPAPVDSTKNAVAAEAPSVRATGSAVDGLEDLGACTTAGAEVANAPTVVEAVSQDTKFRQRLANATALEQQPGHTAVAVEQLDNTVLSTGDVVGSPLGLKLQGNQLEGESFP